MNNQSTLPPLVAPRPAHERPEIDWDQVVGNKAGAYGHAGFLASLA